MSWRTENPYAPEHRALLADSFALRARIQEVEHRSITSPQIRVGLDFAQRHCTSWHAVDREPPCPSEPSSPQSPFSPKSPWSARSPKAVSTWSPPDSPVSQLPPIAPSPPAKVPLAMQTMNMYDFDAWVLAPATRPHRCAFRELLADAEQAPSWFCSHSWGEPVIDLVRCVERHENGPASEQDSGSAPYWIAAFARQPHRGHELPCNLEESNFFKAMQLSNGMLLVGQPCATRLWCLMEVFTWHAGEGARKLEIAEMHHNEAALFHDGTSSAGPRLPIESLRSFFALDLTTAETTCPALGRSWVLNCIAKRPPTQPSWSERNPEYAKANRKLRAMFALIAFQRALGVPHEQPLIQEWDLPALIAADAGRHFLALDFGPESTIADRDIPLLVLPVRQEGLISLRLRFAGCKDLGDVGLRTLVGAFPASLQELQVAFVETNMNTSSANHVTSAGAADFLAGLPEQLQVLNLNFTGLAVSSEDVAWKFEQLPRGLQAMDLEARLSDDGLRSLLAHVRATCLQTFSLRLSQSKISLEVFAELPEKLPATIEVLTLTVDDLGCLTDDGLWHFSSKLPPELTHLTICLRGESTTDEGLSKLLEHLPGTVNSLILSFSSSCISDMGILAIATRLPASLVRLELTCIAQRANWITDNALRALALHLPAAVQSLHVSFESAKASQTHFTSPDALRRAFPAKVRSSLCSVL